MDKLDGLARLAALSAKVSDERKTMLERFKTFEKQLLESAGGAHGSSLAVSLHTWDDENSGVSGGRKGWLCFDGSVLWVDTEFYTDGGHESSTDVHELESVDPDWLASLAVPKVIASLVTNLQENLERKSALLTAANDWLTQFVTVEKAMIDSDLTESFAESASLLDSWQSAKRLVEADPEDSITRSVSHLETVIKGCLRQLGETGHEALPLERLTSRIVKKLREAGTDDDGALESLTGLGTIFRGIGTVRNSRSSAHGKNEGYVAPGVDVAQFVNHLAGVGSAFMLKQTEKIRESQNKTRC